jgi:hypothetical protein
MTGPTDIGPGVAQAVAEAAAALPDGATLDLQSLRLDLPHGAGPEDIRQAVQRALARERPA